MEKSENVPSRMEGRGAEEVYMDLLNNMNVVGISEEDPEDKI